MFRIFRFHPIISEEQRKAREEAERLKKEKQLEKDKKKKLEEDQRKRELEAKKLEEDRLKKLESDQRKGELEAKQLEEDTEKSPADKNAEPESVKIELSMEMPADDDFIQANLYSVYDAIEFYSKPKKLRSKNSFENLGDLPDINLDDISAEDLDSFLEELDVDTETKDKVRQEKQILEDAIKKQQGMLLLSDINWLHICVSEEFAEKEAQKKRGIQRLTHYLNDCLDEEDAKRRLELQKQAELDAEMQKGEYWTIFLDNLAPNIDPYSLVCF